MLAWCQNAQCLKRKSDNNTHHRHHDQPPQRPDLGSADCQCLLAMPDQNREFGDELMSRPSWSHWRHSGHACPPRPQRPSHALLLPAGSLQDRNEERHLNFIAKYLYILRSLEKIRRRSFVSKRLHQSMYKGAQAAQRAFLLYPHIDFASLKLTS